jgi:uncharacterized membrane protein
MIFKYLSHQTFLLFFIGTLFLIVGCKNETSGDQDTGKTEQAEENSVEDQNKESESKMGTNNTNREDQSGELMEMYIFPLRSNCDAGAGMMKCLQVAYQKPEKPSDWQLFYDNIAGFDWEEGTMYHLMVRKMERENIPADAGKYTYSLAEILAYYPNLIDKKQNLTYQEAALKGVSFYAKGPESSWVMEVVPNDRIMIIKSGERPLVFPYEEPRDKEGGWVYKGKKGGNKFTAVLFNNECVEPISGEKFSVQVKLTLNGDLKGGCGMYLESKSPI